MSDCILEPWTCAGKAVVSAVANSALDRFTATVTDAVQQTTNLFLTFWMNPALSPTVASGDSTAENVALLQGALQTVTVVAAVVGVLLGCVRVATTHRAEPLIGVGIMFLSVITVSALAAVSTQIAIQWGDAWSPWILQKATGHEFGSGLPALYPKEASAALGAFLVILLGGLVVLSNLAQIAFMLFRAGVLPLLLAVLPVAAAMSSTEAGKQWFKKILGWLLAFVLYKPVAALVYAGGFAVMQSAGMKGVVNSVGDGLKPLFQMLSGFMIVLLAVLVLPAMIKLVAPMAATGASNLFSAATAAGVVITGAVAVASFGAGTPAVAGAGAGSGTPPTPPPPGGGGGGGGGADTGKSGATAITGGGSGRPALEAGPGGGGTEPAGGGGGSPAGGGGAPRELPATSGSSGGGSSGSRPSGGSSGSSGSGGGSAPPGGGTTTAPAVSSSGGTRPAPSPPPVAQPAAPPPPYAVPPRAGGGLDRVNTARTAASTAAGAVNESVEGGDVPSGAR